MKVFRTIYYPERSKFFLLDDEIGSVVGKVKSDRRNESQIKIDDHVYYCTIESDFPLDVEKSSFVFNTDVKGDDQDE